MNTPTLHTKNAPDAGQGVEGSVHITAEEQIMNSTIVSQPTDTVNADILDDPIVIAYAYGDLDRRRGLDRRHEFADPQAAEGYERGYADADAILAQDRKETMQAIRKAARR